MSNLFLNEIDINRQNFRYFDFLKRKCCNCFARKTNSKCNSSIIMLSLPTIHPQQQWWLHIHLLLMPLIMAHSYHIDNFYPTKPARFGSQIASLIPYASVFLHCSAEAILLYLSGLIEVHMPSTIFSLILYPIFFLGGLHVNHTSNTSTCWVQLTASFIFHVYS